MSSKTLLILTVIVALLGAFIFFVERDLPSTEERAERAKKVLTLEKDDVQAIEIAWNGENGEARRVRLERQEEPEIEDDGQGDVFASPAPEWRLIEPLAARADADAVDELLTSLLGLEKDRTMDRTEIDLESPRGRVILATANGDATLEIGGEVPGTSGMLVALDGGAEVHQVGNSVWDDLVREPGEWRDPSLFPYSRSEIERLTLRSPAGQVLLARRGEEFWVESPLTDLADEERVDGLLNELTGLEAASFTDRPPPLEELGLAVPDRVIEVVLAEREEPFRLTLGGALGEADGLDGERRYNARVEGQVVEIDTRLGTAFERGAEEWRSRAWAPLQVFEIDAARFIDAAGEIELVREDGDWRRDGERVDYSVASDALYALTDVGAAEVVSPAAAAERGHALGAAPLLEIVLESGGLGEEEGVTSQTLRLFNAVEGLVAATREGREAVLLVAEEKAGNLRTAVDELRSAEVLEEESEEESP